MTPKSKPTADNDNWPDGYEPVWHWSERLYVPISQWRFLDHLSWFVPLALLIVTVISIVIVGCNYGRCAERTPDDWFTLVVEIQRDLEQADKAGRKLPNIDAEDRRFIRKMMNDLSVSAEAKPTSQQGQWLLAIKEWLK